MKKNQGRIKGNSCIDFGSFLCYNKCMDTSERSFSMAYITCPSCNKTITNKTPFCRYCGSAHGMTPTALTGKPSARSRASTGAAPTQGDAPKVPRAPRKKTATSAPRMPKLPDQTQQNTVRRFILHAIVSVIGVALAAVLGMLLGELGIKLFELISSEIDAFVVMLIFSFIGAAIAGLIVGVAGPIAKESFRPEADKPFIIYAKAAPLKKLSFAYYAFFAIALALFLYFQVELGEQVKELLGSDAKEYYFYFIAYCAAVYYLVFPLASYLHVCFASCPACGCIDCKIKIGESAHESTTQEQTRERTYAGASYDVYTTDGTHVGTVRGSDSTVTETREVTTESWQNIYRCVICGKEGSEKEFKTTKTKWS